MSILVAAMRRGIVVVAMNVMILSIGSELTTGHTLDTNARWLAAELTLRGHRVAAHLSVADDVGDICAAVRHALDEYDGVIATGGLGPTPDDVTREALALALDVLLEENEPALEHLRAFFARLGRTMPESNRRQAMVPQGCEIIPNARGTAPGVYWRDSDQDSEKVLIALPGVPSEMRAMFRAEVLPHLLASPEVSAVVRMQWHCFGISEAEVGQQLSDLMQRGRNPDVGTSASGAVITVRVVAQADTVVEAEELAERDGSEIRRRLGQAVFGKEGDTLEGRVAELLTRKGATLSVAESCTGGMLGMLLTRVPGSSRYFMRGYVTYSDASKVDLLDVAESRIKKYGAVSEQVAREMASGCRTASGSDYAISVTGIAGPGGGSTPDKPVGLVYIGIADAAEVVVKRLLLGEHRERDEVRNGACSHALDLLRRRLEAGQ